MIILLPVLPKYSWKTEIDFGMNRVFVQEVPDPAAGCLSRLFIDNVLGLAGLAGVFPLPPPSWGSVLARTYLIIAAISRISVSPIPSVVMAAVPKRRPLVYQAPWGSKGRGVPVERNATGPQDAFRLAPVKPEGSIDVNQEHVVVRCRWWQPSSPR